MKRPCLAVLSRLALFVAGVVAVAGSASAADSAAVKKIFADPPREYASAPLWVWNDMLTEEQIARHAARPGRPEGQAGLRASAARA